jgi:hypothetical protein
MKQPVSKNNYSQWTLDIQWRIRCPSIHGWRTRPEAALWRGEMDRSAARTSQTWVASIQWSGSSVGS